MSTIVGETPQRAKAWLAGFGGAFNRWFERRARYRALQALDSRTLKDIGLHRAEIGSVVSELSGEVAVTRRQARPQSSNVAALPRARRVVPETHARRKAA